MAAENIMNYDTVALDDEKDALVIIDQTKLPNELVILELTELEDIREAIYLLKVRGAPAIGVAAAIGIYLAARQISLDKPDFDSFYNKFTEAKDYLAGSRPTAVNLFWALDRMDNVVKVNSDKPVEEIVEKLHDEAVEIREDDIRVCRSIGEYGLTLIHDGCGMWYLQRMAPEGVKAYNPAFDFADNELITAIITEYVIARPPYSKSLKDIFAKIP